MSKPEVSGRPPRVLMLLPKSGYRNDDFLDAADRMGVDVIPVRNSCRRLAGFWGMASMLAVPFDNPAAAARKITDALGDALPDAVLGIDDQGVEAAAAISAALALDGNSPLAVANLRDKFRFRELQKTCGLPAPGVRALTPDAIAGMDCSRFEFPCVIKATRLSGSRGVIRADNAQQCRAALHRVAHILQHEKSAANDATMLVEDYLPGKEHALEGMLVNGRLQTLAVFDKPEPLEGPFFAETIYVTPPPCSSSVLSVFSRQVETVCRAAGVLNGPVHAEARVNGDTLTLLEVAPRTIGGLCSRVLRHALGMSLEELVLRHAIGLRDSVRMTNDRASGVMMIPVPQAGIFQGIDGINAALAVPGIDDVQVSASPGDRVLPLPEASTYLGFVFASGAQPEFVKSSLQTARSRLCINIKEMVDVDVAAASG